jgi:hypothetical protein
MAVKDGCMLKWRSRAKTRRRRGTYLLRRRRRGREPPPPEAAARPSGQQPMRAQAAKLRSPPAAAKCQTSRRSDRVLNGERDLPPGRGHMLACDGGRGVVGSGSWMRRRNGGNYCHFIITYRRGRVGRDGAPAAARPLCRLDVSGSSARCLSTTSSNRCPFLSFLGRGRESQGGRWAPSSEGPLRLSPCMRLASASGFCQACCPCSQVGAGAGKAAARSLPRVISFLLPWTCRVARHCFGHKHRCTPDERLECGTHSA